MPESPPVTSALRPMSRPEGTVVCSHANPQCPKWSSLRMVIDHVFGAHYRLNLESFFESHIDLVLCGRATTASEIEEHNHRTPRKLMRNTAPRRLASCMTRSRVQNKEGLRSIARRAMLQRGLLPDFSPEVLSETSASAVAVAQAQPSIRDLRGLPWASIDNDDSRDLDQLSVAQPMAGDAVKILVAIADVDATVKQRSATDGPRRPTRRRFTQLRRSSRCCPRSSRPTSLLCGKERHACRS